MLHKFFYAMYSHMVAGKNIDSFWNMGMCELFVIPDDDPRIGLRGQKGLRLRAGCAVNKGEYIGPYGGFMYYNDEDLSFLSSEDRKRCNETGAKLWTGRRCSCPAQHKLPDLSVAGLTGSGIGTKLVYLNDYRITGTDDKTGIDTVNVALVSAKHEGIPYTLIQANRDISELEELVLDYGPGYYGRRGAAPLTPPDESTYSSPV
jgi:hypothetical protein